MQDPATPAQDTASAQTAQRVGRGALFITGGKLWFMLTAATVNFVLGSLLGSVDYGNYGVTVRWVSLLNMMLVQGLLQGMSRLVAQQPQAALGLWHAARKVAVGLGLGAAVLLAALSWPLADVLGDARLQPLLMAAGLISAAYALYAPQVGVLNGLQRFLHQALLDMGFSTAKLVFILVPAALGLGALGSVLGFGTAAALMALVAGLTLRGAPAGAPSQRLTAGALMGFSGAVMGYQGLANLLMLLDLAVVKRGAAQGWVGVLDPGYYTAAVNLAQVPYLGCTAIVFVVFPLLGAANNASAPQIGSTVTAALRYALLVGAPVSAAMAAAAPGVLTAVFPSAYVAAAPALRMLSLAYLCMALASVVCTMLNALGRPIRSAAVVLAGVAASAVVLWVAVPQWGMLGGAGAAVVGMGVSLTVGLVALRRTGGAGLPWRSMARHGVAAAVVLGVGLSVNWPQGSWTARALGAGGAVALWALHVVLLAVLREIGPAEWNLLRRVAGRRT